MLTQWYIDHNEPNRVQSQSTVTADKETPGEQRSRMGDRAYANRHPVQCYARAVHEACGLPSSCLLWVCRPCTAHSKGASMMLVKVGLHECKNQLPPLSCLPWKRETVQVNDEHEIRCCSTRAHNVIFRTYWLLCALCSKTKLAIWKQPQPRQPIIWRDGAKAKTIALLTTKDKYRCQRNCLQQTFTVGSETREKSCLKNAISWCFGLFFSYLWLVLALCRVL